MQRTLSLGKFSLGRLGLACGTILSLGFAGLVWPLTAAEKDTTPIRVTQCRIKPADQVTLSVNQSGVIGSIPREGDTVEPEQLVIQLEDALARAALAVAEKEAGNDVKVRYAAKAADVSRLTWEDAVEINMNVKGAIPETEVRLKKLEYDRDVLQIEQTEHDQTIALLKRDEAEAQLKLFHVKSPVAGTVTRVLKNKGEAVRQGEPVLELVNTRRVRVEGYLDVADRRRVAPGCPVQVTPEAAEGAPAAAPATGTIVFVDVVVQPVTSKVRIWADVDNPDDLLLPGLTVNMSIAPRKTSLTATTGKTTTGKTR